MHRGFVKLWRKSMDSEIFKDAYLQQLWDWCMMKASWKDDVVTWKTGRGNVLVPIKRGQFVFGRHAAAKALGGNPSTVSRRMEVLSRRGMLGIEPGTHYSIVTVLNYRHYQDEQEASRQASGHPSGHPMGTYKKLENKEQPVGVADANASKGKPRIKTFYDEHGRPYPVLPSRPPDPEVPQLQDQDEEQGEGR